jgi:hypothetical protein
MRLRRTVGWNTVSELLYWILVLLLGCLVALSAVFLLSQAVRTSPRRTFAKNFDTIVIGACYVAVVRPHSACIEYTGIESPFSLLHRYSSASSAVHRYTGGYNGYLKDIGLLARRMFLRYAVRSREMCFLSSYHQSVHHYIAQEYARACLIAYESVPKDGFQPGWGRPGSL